MDRREKMKRCLSPYRLRWLNERIENIGTDAVQSIRDGLLPILQEIMQQAIRMQKEAGSWKTAYLIIFYLRSSIATGSHDYLVMLSDQTLYLDNKRIERYWRPEQLYRNQEKDILLARNEIKKNFVRVSDYENHFIRRLIEEDYFAFLEIGLSKELPRIQEWELFRSMKKEDNFCCLYGEYMGELKRLFEKEAKR